MTSLRQKPSESMRVLTHRKPSGWVLFDNDGNVTFNE